MESSLRFAGFAELYGEFAKVRWVRRTVWRVRWVRRTVRSFQPLVLFVRTRKLYFEFTLKVQFKFHVNQTIAISQGLTPMQQNHSKNIKNKTINKEQNSQETFHVECLQNWQVDSLVSKKDIQKMLIIPPI